MGGRYHRCCFKDLAARPHGTSSHYEKLLHERHWTVGHNHCKEARPTANAFLHALLLRRLCISGILKQCVPAVSSSSSPSTGRTASDILLNQLSTNTDLEQRLLPKVLELVRSPDGHRICLGNWSTYQLEILSDALTASDTAEAIDRGGI